MDSRRESCKQPIRSARHVNCSFVKVPIDVTMTIVNLSSQSTSGTAAGASQTKQKIKL